MAHRYRHRHRLGGLRREFAGHPIPAADSAHVRGRLVLSGDFYRRGGVACGRCARIARLFDQELSALRRGGGRSGPGVVRIQRGALPADHALSGLCLLLPAQGGRPAPVLPPPGRHPLLGDAIYLQLGRPQPVAPHGAARLDPIAGHGLRRCADRAGVGGGGQRAADAARGLGSGARQSGAQVPGPGGGGLWHRR